MDIPLSLYPARCHSLLTCAQASAAINKAKQRTTLGQSFERGWIHAGKGHMGAHLSTAASHSAWLETSPPDKSHQVEPGRETPLLDSLLESFGEKI